MPPVLQLYAHLRYIGVFVKLVDRCNRREHRVLEDVESERLGVRIWELFTILYSASCPPPRVNTSTFERNNAKAHSESGEAA